MHGCKDCRANSVHSNQRSLSLGMIISECPVRWEPCCLTFSSNQPHPGIAPSPRCRSHHATYACDVIACARGLLDGLLDGPCHHEPASAGEGVPAGTASVRRRLQAERRLATCASSVAGCHRYRSCRRFHSKRSRRQLGSAKSDTAQDAWQPVEGRTDRPRLSCHDEVCQRCHRLLVPALTVQANQRARRVRLQSLSLASRRHQVVFE